MNRIDQTFARLKRSKQKALICYMTGGFPSKAGFLRTIPELEKAGLDMLEVGVPFSDPVADGTTIQRASQAALKNGVTLEWILQAVKTLRRDVKLPIILMSYCNPMLSMGLERFFARAKAAGVDGLIIPDLTPDEGKPFEDLAKKNGLDLIYLVTPNTSPKRLHQIARATRGFLYVVSLTGITGARTSLSSGLNGFIARLRKLTSKPLAMGFGISTPAQVRSLRNRVDGIIVGSALIDHLEQSSRRAIHFVGSLKTALNSKGVHHAS